MFGLGFGLMDMAVQGRGNNSPAPSFNLSSIDVDGWQATIKTVPTEFDPLGSPDTFSVTRQGFNSSGTAISVLDALILMKRVRQPYPNQNSLTVDQAAISEFVYAGDTIAGVVNNSTRPYPRPQALWLNHDLDVATSSTYTARLAVAHAHARNGRPVAAVKFTATDGTTTVEQTISAMSVISYLASGRSVPHFAATLDFTTLNQGAMITIDAVIYPWVGDAFTVSTANSYPSPNLTSFKVLNDRTGAYGTAYAYVDGVGAGTPAVSEVAATAQANPYATVAAAATAIQTYNNANFSRNSASGGIIRLEVGTHVHSSYSSVLVTDTPLIIEAANAANKSTTIYQDAATSTNNSCPDYLKLRNLVIQRTGGSKIVFSNGAGITNNDNMFVTENCTWDLNGASIYAAAIYTVGRFWNINCDGDNIGQCQIFSTARKTSISIGSGNGSVQSGTYHAVGCKDLDGLFAQVVPSTNRPASFGQFLGWSHIGQNTNGTNVLRLDALDVGVEGFAAVGNVFEHYGGSTGPAFFVDADGNVNALENGNILCNTIVGSRTNYAYQDSGTVRINKTVTHRFCVHTNLNTKSDVFGTDGNLIGNWPVIYRVGHRANTALEASAGGDTPGIGSWLGEISAFGDVNGTNATPLNPDWTNDQSFTVAGTGNGDYTPGALTALPAIPSGLAPYSHDQNGTAIANDGTAYIGALQ